MLRWLLAPCTVKSPPRSFTIHAFVERWLMEEKKEATIKAVEKIVAYASYVFEKNFRINFLLTGIEPWHLPKYTDEPTMVDPRKTLDEMAGFRLTCDAEIMLTFVPDALVKLIPCKGNSEIVESKVLGGMALPASGCAIISSLFDIPNASRYALHEIGHLFGAGHVTSWTPAIMARTDFFYSFRTKASKIFCRFDRKNAEIIMRNKDQLTWRSQNLF